MRQSDFFAKTFRQVPKEAKTISHQLLVRAGYVNQLTAGIWSFLPLGWRVYKKIEEIIRQEMEAIGGQEVFLPALQPKELWQETERWETMDPPLFKIKDRHEKWLTLGPTHEEVMTDLARQYISSYKDLPIAPFQIQNKFRNEMRPSGGLLRTREFIMKDLYSFHQIEKDLDQYYQKVKVAYQKIYQRCNLKTMVVEAATGSIGGSESHEFMVLAESGEDKILVCPEDGWAVNLEIGQKYKKCPQCNGKLEQKNTIEAGHIFKLGAKYSQAMNAYFTDKNGQKRPVVMGCYGIGLPRLMATVVEVHHDQKGIIWPKTLSPFDFHLICLDITDRKIAKFAEKVYTELTRRGFEVLYDDRRESAGVKFKDADLIGISIRLVVSKKAGQKIEYKERSGNRLKLLELKSVVKLINS